MCSLCFLIFVLLKYHDGVLCQCFELSLYHACSIGYQITVSFSLFLCCSSPCLLQCWALSGYLPVAVLLWQGLQLVGCVRQQRWSVDIRRPVRKCFCPDHGSRAQQFQPDTGTSSGGKPIGLHSATSQSVIKLAVYFRPVLSRIRTAEPILGLSGVTSQSAIISDVVPLWNCGAVTVVQPYIPGVWVYCTASSWGCQ